MPLGETLSGYWQTIQGELFPWLEEAVGPLSTRQKLLVTVLELVRVEAFVRDWPGLLGRPRKDRAALARAFVAKAVYNMATTGTLIERLRTDKTLRRLCGWARQGAVPSEATFSRAFAEFAASDLPGRLHEALITETQGGRLVGSGSKCGRIAF